MSSKKGLKQPNNQFKFKVLDEETLRAMIRTAVLEGSTGDDKIRFVLQDPSDETSCMACGGVLLGCGQGHMQAMNQQQQ